MKKSFLQYLLDLIYRKQQREAQHKSDLLYEMGPTFYYWAEEYFTKEKLNVELRLNNALDSFRRCYSAAFSVSERQFKRKIYTYCELKGYLYNPPELRDMYGRIIRFSETERRIFEVIFLKTQR